MTVYYRPAKYQQLAIVPRIYIICIVHALRCVISRELCEKIIIASTPPRFIDKITTKNVETKLRLLHPLSPHPHTHRYTHYKTFGKLVMPWLVRGRGEVGKSWLISIIETITLTKYVCLLAQYNCSNYDKAPTYISIDFTINISMKHIVIDVYKTANNPSYWNSFLNHTHNAGNGN